jgi:hypothetical protein
VAYILDDKFLASGMKPSATNRFDKISRYGFSVYLSILMTDRFNCFIVSPPMFHLFMVIGNSSNS